jgi:hypothetical protein
MVSKKTVPVQLVGGEYDLLLELYMRLGSASLSSTLRYCLLQSAKEAGIGNSLIARIEAERQQVRRRAANGGLVATIIHRERKKLQEDLPLFKEAEGRKEKSAKRKKRS